MGPREEQFLETMGQGVPAFELVVGEPGNAVACRVLDGLSLHHTAQPLLGDHEHEVARLVCSVYGAVAVGPDGTAGGTPDSAHVSLVKTGESAGVVVFTDRRVVAALAMGEFLGMRLDHDRDQRAVLMSLGYGDLDSMEIASQKKLLGGRKPVGFQVSVVAPSMAALRIEPIGETSLELHSDRVTDLRPWFDRIVAAVCDSQLVDASGGLADQLKRTREGGYEQNDDGDPVAIFNPEEAADG